MALIIKVFSISSHCCSSHLYVFPRVQCKDSSLNTDSFMAALSEGANETEVRSLRYVNSHISHLQKTGVQVCYVDYFLLLGLV